MALDLNEVRRVFAEYLAGDPSARWRMDAALAEAGVFAYLAGLAEAEADGEKPYYHANRLRLASGKKPIRIMLDSVQSLDGVNEDGYVGHIFKDGTLVGRVDIGEDGKAMVFVGGSGDVRVKFKSGVVAGYSDDDAAEMVESLFSVTQDVPGSERAENDPNMGREWDSPYGRQRIAKLLPHPTGDMYEVETIGKSEVRRYQTNRIEDVIAGDEHRLTPEYAKEVADREEISKLKAESAARVKEEDDRINAELQAFADWAGMSAVNAGKAIQALKHVVQVKGNFMSRKKWMESLVDAGYTYEDDRTYGPIMKAPDGSFYDQKAMSKTAVSYAQYLIQKKAIEPAMNEETVKDKFAAIVQAATKTDNGRKEFVDAMTFLTPFMSRSQLGAMKQGAVGEEAQYFYDKAVELANTIKNMPATYGQDGKGDEAVAYLHYFRGGADWYITEKDIDGGVQQAFGLADLGQGAELGYISIEELARNGVELDFHWAPKTIGAIKEKDAVEEKKGAERRPDSRYEFLAGPECETGGGICQRIKK